MENDLLGAIVEYAVQFLQTNLCCNRNLPCFVSLYLPRSCLVLVLYNKTNVPCLFLFNVEIIHH